VSEGEAICPFAHPELSEPIFAAGVTRRRLCVDLELTARAAAVAPPRYAAISSSMRAGPSWEEHRSPARPHGGQHGLGATHRTLRLSTQRSVDRIPSILSGEQCELGGASGQSSGFCQIVKLSTHLTITRTGDPEISLSSTTRLVWPIFLEHSLDNESIDRMVAQTLVTCRSRS